MIEEELEDAVLKGTTSMFAGIASAFVMESISHMIPWLMVSASIVVCDLIVGLRKASKLGEEIRFSKAARRTMAKMVTYFAFVVMLCFIDIAIDDKYPVDIIGCLVVCAIEVSSIFSNWLKIKGYDLDAFKFLGLVIKKLIGHEINLSEFIKEEKKNETD